MPDRIIAILEAWGYAGEEKRGQDGGVLPVEQANDSPARVGWAPNDDIALLEVWMAGAEMTESGVPRDEGQCDEEIALLDVGRRRLLLVLVAIPPLTAERQERPTEPLEISQSLAGCCYEHCFGAFVYSNWLVQERDIKEAESGVCGLWSASSCDLLPYHIGSLVSGPTQKRSSL